jgi:hypothetical protein
MNAHRRFWMGLAVGVACLPGVARGQTDVPPRASAARVVQSQTSNGVAPGRSGRVAGAVFYPDRAAIAGAAIPAAGPELSVTAAMAAAVGPEPVGRVNVRLLDRDITAKFASLDHCRTDVARRKRVPPALITANTLTLRWTIAGKGQVEAMDVVGSTPVDPEVLDCVKRDANRWLFTAPVGGDVRLNRALVFRRWSPVTARP